MKFYQMCSKDGLTTKMQILTIEGYIILEVSYIPNLGLYTIVAERKGTT